MHKKVFFLSIRLIKMIIIINEGAINEYMSGWIARLDKKEWPSILILVTVMLLSAVLLFREPGGSLMQVVLASNQCLMMVGWAPMKLPHSMAKWLPIKPISPAPQPWDESPCPGDVANLADRSVRPGGVVGRDGGRTRRRCVCGVAPVGYCRADAPSPSAAACRPPRCSPPWK